MGQLEILWLKGGPPMYFLAALGALLWLGVTLILVQACSRPREVSWVAVAVICIGAFALMGLGWASEVALFRYYEVNYISKARAEFTDQIRAAAHAEVIVDRMFGVLLATPAFAAAGFAAVRRVSSGMLATCVGLFAGAAVLVSGLAGVGVIADRKANLEQEANSFAPLVARAVREVGTRVRGTAGK